MEENIKNAIEYASSDNIADMQASITAAIQSKIVDALESKRIEVAQSFMNTNESLEEARKSKQHPLEGHEYHSKSDDQLRFIMKDAGEAAKAMRTHGTISGDKAEAKYLDQVNDASGVLYWRKNNGTPDWYMQRYLKKSANESLEEATFKFTGYASNSPHDDRSNRHDFEVKAKTTKHANDKAIKIMHTKFPDHTYHGVKIASEKSANESLEEKLIGKQRKLDKNKNGRLDSQDFKMIRKESEELEEKLSVSDGVSAWIKDFVHSDDSRFEGKSKEERRQMALGAYYAAKKKATNEEVEE
jgi:hypothetical protein